MGDFKPEKDTCPVCNTEWTKTSFGARTWYDCSQCEKTAEELTGKDTKSSSTSDKKEIKLDSLEEWEMFIDMMNMDDDYDGSVFLGEFYD